MVISTEYYLATSLPKLLILALKKTLWNKWLILTFMSHVLREVQMPNKNQTLNLQLEERYFKTPEDL